MDPGMFLKRFLQEMWEFPGMVLLLEALLAALLPCHHSQAAKGSTFHVL